MKNKLSPPEKWILLGIPVTFLAGSLLHFLYDFSGGNPFIGTFSPINESIWEHCKIAAFPIAAWWILYYLWKGKTYSLSASHWFTGTLAALIVSILTVPLTFYFYTQAFGVESLVIDIFILLLAVFLGQLAGLHFYRYAKPVNPVFRIAAVIFILLLFVIFTFFPPDLPIFMDPS